MTDGANDDFWRRLLYRWFVQYNPLYLVSAMLVLGGTILTSRGLALEGSLHGQLGVAAIAELYALVLIGGAALLTRIGQRRPAVMLAVLTALYQCDLTLHTETCVQLGATGVVASAVWFVVFGGKLAALAWAVKARLSRGAYAVALVGAGALTIGPYVVENGDASRSGAFIAAIVFALAALAPKATITTTTELDPWGQTVFARTVKVVWSLLGGIGALHVLFWASGHNIALGALFAAVVMLCAARVRSEAVAWGLAATTLLVTAVSAADGLWFSALLASAMFTLRAFKRTAVTVAAQAVAEPNPYRHGEATSAPQWVTTLEPATPGARARQLTGALFSFYLALWTFGWSRLGGDCHCTVASWPAHSLLIDGIVLVLAIALALRVKPRLSLLVPSFAGVHALAVSGLVPTPHSSLGWGSSALVAGFALLLGALATSYRLRRFTVPDA